MSDSRIGFGDGVGLVDGRKRLVHVKGLTVPKKCPSGGFPFEVTISFEDGTASTDKYTLACPRT